MEIIAQTSFTLSGLIVLHILIVYEFSFYSCGFAGGSRHKIPLRKGGKGVVKLRKNTTPYVPLVY
ncbi:MAG: hypothetical protein HYV59_07580 [Planctomycetes bacterium]|nr:hypothetical protein [Planctomycetota bacterium]